MAGKHIGGDGNPRPNPDALWLTPHQFSPRLDRAYAEGRQTAFEGGDLGDNPFTSGKEFSTWNFGFNNAGSAAHQFETAYAGTV